MNNKLSICVIDDDEIIRFTITKQIERAKIADETNTFNNGKEALNFLQNQIKNNGRIPDVILLDIVMPIMDGWQFLQEYQKLKSQIKKNILIYIVSSSSNPVDIERGKKIDEVHGYLIKPVTSEKLQKIADTLRG